MPKSSRHSKITGDFGEALMLYWLSKRGFECARVDHTGIDLIARRPNSEEVLGISVKSRSRNEGKEAEGINLLRKDDHKIELACQAFHCAPYVAVIADQGSVVRAFLLSLEHARSLAPGGSWGMSPKKILCYKADSRIESFELESRHGDWRAAACADGRGHDKGTAGGITHSIERTASGKAVSAAHVKRLAPKRMSTFNERIDRLGTELVACKDGCAGILQRQSDGILPRSLFLERPYATGRGCLAVGLNPGTSKPLERAFYLEHEITYDRVKTYRTRISAGPYFTRTQSVIDQLGLTGPIIWSNLAKCENESDRDGLPPLQTLRHCTRRFLARELHESPSDWVVLGIGWEAYRALAYLVPERTMIGIPHPTGGYRDFRKMLHEGNLRTEIRTRALGALRAFEPGAVWLGSEKTGA